nr:hypothetical protein CFP56_24476 [Quercus suber]
MSVDQGLLYTSLQSSAAHPAQFTMHTAVDESVERTDRRIRPPARLVQLKPAFCLPYDVLDDEAELHIEQETSELDRND